MFARNCVRPELCRPELCRPKTTFSKIGKIVDENINILNNIYETVRVDKYVIMPNHIHLIVVIQNGRTQYKTGEHSSPLLCRALLNNSRAKSQNRLAFAFGKNPFMTILFVTKRIICKFGSISKIILLNGQRINILFNRQISVCRAKNYPPKRNRISFRWVFLCHKALRDCDFSQQ